MIKVLGSNYPLEICYHSLVVCTLCHFDITQKGPTYNTQIVIVTKQISLNKGL